MKESNWFKLAACLPLAAILGYAVGMLPVNLVNFQIVAFSQNQGLSEGPASLVIMCELAAFALSLIFSGFIPSRAYQTVGVVGSISACLAQLGCIAIQDLFSICALKVVAGAGMGAACSIMIRLISQSEDAGKSYGIANALFAFLIGVMSVAIPWLPSDDPGIRAFVPLSLCSLSVALIVIFAVRHGATFEVAIKSNAAPLADVDHKRATALLFAALITFLPLGGIWTFSVASGLSLGISERGVGVALALMMPGGVAGGALSAWLSGRIRNTTQLLIACALSVCVCIAVSLPTGVISFTLGFMFYALTYTFGVTAFEATSIDVDADGRLAAIVFGVTLLSNALGTIVVGTLIEFGHKNLITMLGASFCAAAVGPVWWLIGQSKGRGAARYRVPSTEGL